ncbi:ATP-binding protein [Megasphaera elsdenii]|uniref:ATP-binding protein n=1 Tax=Megasphaera elsdenii TaxID=907 RepID=UPI0026603C8A|nr:ATP-binding protein [Megasphaera elsdenii]
MGKEVGQIVEVKGVLARAELYELFPPYIVERGKVQVAPRINSYVKTKVGLDVIICQITGEYYDENQRGKFTGYYLKLMVKGYFEGNKFIQGLRLLPMVAANIELLDADEFKDINKCSDEQVFSIGNDIFNSHQEYYLSYNSIIPSHIGIFGNTGSGKSNTLAKLLFEYSNVIRGQSNAYLLLIDVNNEYGGTAICESENKTVYQLTTRKNSINRIPIDFSQFQEDEWCLLLNATEATQRPVIKTAFKDSKTEDEYRELIVRMIKTGQHALIKSMQYHLAEYISGISEIFWHSKNEVFYVNMDDMSIYSNEEKFKRVYDQIQVNIPQTSLKKFLFKLYFATSIHIGYGTQYEFISPLLRRAEKLVNDFEKVFEDCERNIFNDTNIAVVQLANVNRDMIEIIPSILTTHLFNQQIENKDNNSVNKIINIVVDEAHNLLYEDDTDSRHSRITLEAFERAIKEGRKFGLYLWIASQRPSDISQSIISQMHNYFIHKLVNPYDLNRIRKAVAFLDENSMNALTVLGPGECVISGTGMNMPCFVKIQQLEKKYRPNSENIKLFGEGGILKRGNT